MLRPDNYRKMDPTRTNGLEAKSKGRAKDSLVHVWNGSVDKIKGPKEPSFGTGRRANNISSTEQAAPFCRQRPSSEQLRKGAHGRIQFLNNLRPADFLDPIELENNWTDDEHQPDHLTQMTENTISTKEGCNNSLFGRLKATIGGRLRSLFRIPTK